MNALGRRVARTCRAVQRVQWVGGFIREKLPTHVVGMHDLAVALPGRVSCRRDTERRAPVDGGR